MSWQTIIKENGLAVSEISLSDVLTVKRLDAEYFDPAYLASDTMLNTKPHSPISDYVSISDGNHLSISEYFTKIRDAIAFVREILTDREMVSVRNTLIVQSRIM